MSVSGIRGIVGAGLTPEAAARFAAAFGSTVAGQRVILSCATAAPAARCSVMRFLH